jgi:hypothetical protein
MDEKSTLISYKNKIYILFTINTSLTILLT